MNKIIDKLHYVYLFAALLGGGCAFYFAMMGVLEHKGHFDVFEFASSIWLDNYYAKSLNIDFLTGTTVGTFFIIVEGYRLKMKKVWLYILLTVCIAFAFGFPLFLFFRTLHLKRLKLVEKNV
jgi:hypothetical protein